MFKTKRAVASEQEEQTRQSAAELSARERDRELDKVNMQAGQKFLRELNADLLSREERELVGQANDLQTTVARAESIVAGLQDQLTEFPKALQREIASCEREITVGRTLDGFMFERARRLSALRAIESCLTKQEADRTAEIERHESGLVGLRENLAKVIARLKEVQAKL